MSNRESLERLKRNENGYYGPVETITDLSERVDIVGLFNKVSKKPYIIGSEDRDAYDYDKEISKSEKRWIVFYAVLAIGVTYAMINGKWGRDRSANVSEIMESRK